MMAAIATKKESNQNTVVSLILVLYHDGQQQLSNKQIQKLRPTISRKSNRLNFISDETRLRSKKVVTYSQGDLSLVPIQKGFPLFDGDGDGVPLTRHLMVWFSSQEPVFILIFHYASIV